MSSNYGTGSVSEEAIKITTERQNRAAEHLKIRERALRDVLAERERQIAKGWTPEHDDGHGVDHIVVEANRRHLQRLGNGPRLTVTLARYRTWLVQEAALYVAAIEALDRRPDARVPDDVVPGGAR